MLNTVIVACTVTLGQIICRSMAGYAFARLRFLGGCYLLPIPSYNDDPEHGDADPIVYHRARARLVDSISGLILPFILKRFGDVLGAPVPYEHPR